MVAACAAYYRMGPAPRERLVAAIEWQLLGNDIDEDRAGNSRPFSGYEWLALAVWGLIGLGLGWRNGHLKLLPRVNKREAEPMKRSDFFRRSDFSYLF